MDLCRWWGRDLQWWNELEPEDRVIYMAHWNVTQVAAAKAAKD